MKTRSDSAGFSLLELMITVAIIGILAAVAYPSYKEQVAVSRRNEAATALMTGAQALERYYSVNGRYTSSASGSALPSVFPAKVPENGAAYYTISAAGQSEANRFTLKATRTGVMAADACGDFTINETGANGLLNATKTLAQCWRR